jgi:hypothetical protein
MDPEKVLFIVVGVVVVVAVGQLLIHSGRRYIARGAPTESAAAGPAANLVAVLFHLLTLGIVVLLSIMSVGATVEIRFLVQLGVLLIVLAAVYGIALTQLDRRRDEALVAEVEAHGESREQESGTGLRIRPADPSATTNDMRTR